MIQIDQKSANGVDTPELADACFMVQSDGSVQAFGSSRDHGGRKLMLRFASVGDLMKGGPYDIHGVDMRDPDGTPTGSKADYHQPWDTTREPWGIMYSGALPKSVAGAYWLDLNVGRDIYAYLPARAKAIYSEEQLRSMSYQEMARVLGPILAELKDQADVKWDRLEHSIFHDPENPRDHGSYLGHRYGHRFLEVGGQSFVFFEEVVSLKPDGEPLETHIRAQKMKNYIQTEGPVITLVKPLNEHGVAYPSAKRADGAMLVEGPSPYLSPDGKTLHVLFSAGDFFDTQARYGVNHASLDTEAFLSAFAGGSGELNASVSVSDEGDLWNALRKPTLNLGVQFGLSRPTPVYGPDRQPLHREDGAMLISVHGALEPVQSAWQGWHDNRGSFLVWVKTEHGPQGDRLVMADEPGSR